MARLIIVTPAAPGSKTTTPNLQIVEIPEAETLPATPVLPGVTFNGSPEQFLDFVRQVGNAGLRPEPAPLTTGQRFMRLVEEGYWGLVGFITAIFRAIGFGLTLILVYLILAWNGVVPGPNWEFLMDAAGIQQIEEAPPAPVRTGASLNDRLDALGQQIGGIETKVNGIEGQLAEQPEVVVQEAPPAPVPAAPVVKQPWRLFPKKAATP